jgi:hypothetical protein
MKNIKEKSNEYADEQDFRMAYNGSCDNCRQGFVVGANYVLDEIEEFMTTMNLGNNYAEKFYKLDLMADIHGFIEKLKSNQ